MESFLPHDVISSIWLCKVFFKTAPGVTLRYSQIKNHNFKWKFSVILPFKGFGPNLNQSPLPKSAIILPNVLWSECFFVLHFIPLATAWWPLIFTFHTHMQPVNSFTCFLLYGIVQTHALHFASIPQSPCKALKLSCFFTTSFPLECQSSSVSPKAFFPASIMLLQASKHKGPSII